MKTKSLDGTREAVVLSSKNAIFSKNESTHWGFEACRRRIWQVKILLARADFLENFKFAH